MKNMKNIILVSIFTALGISVNANAEYTQQTEESHSTQSTHTQGSGRVLPGETTVREVQVPGPVREVPGPVREVLVPGPVQVIKEPAPAQAPAPNINIKVDD
jgi:hypothetical protein